MEDRRLATTFSEDESHRRRKRRLPQQTVLARAAASDLSGSGTIGTESATKEDSTLAPSRLALMEVSNTTGVDLVCRTSGPPF